MKIKNLEIKKLLRNTTIALVTGAVMTTTPVGLSHKVEASSYIENYTIMNYFTGTVQYDVNKYLDKDETSTNLTKLLNYYDTLYDYINYGKSVNGSYYNQLNNYEQEQLSYLLSVWGNEIYDKYRSKSYFSSTCNKVLGFSLKYTSQEMGYDDDHEKVYEYFTEELDERLDQRLSYSNSQSNLKSALDTYETLLSFVEGTYRYDGYVLTELTLTEQEDIIRLLENWTYDIENTYGTYSYYSSTCRNNIGWTVNINNLYLEYGKYMNVENIPVINPTYPTVTPNYGINNYIPTVPSINNNIQNNNQNNINNNQNVTNQPSINNTVGKNWFNNYIDPSINIQRDEYDYVPENINDLGNDPYRYTQDFYGNYYPYGNYPQDGYVEDYVPTYIP